MAQWVGIVISGLIGLAGLLLAAKAHRLAQAQEDRARSSWAFRAFPTGPTATEQIVLQFTNEGAAIAWAPRLDMEALMAFAVLEYRQPARLDPGESMAVTVRHDPRVLTYPMRLCLRWRTGPVRGRRLESWVDVTQWRQVATQISS